MVGISSTTFDNYSIEFALLCFVVNVLGKWRKGFLHVYGVGIAGRMAQDTYRRLA
jgi:hypothetical protein